MIEKKHLFVIVLLFISLPGFSQVLSDSSAIQKFSFLTRNTNEGNNYILVHIDKSAPGDLRNTILLRSVRQFSENVFVIEKEKLLNTTRPFFRQYSLSNNYWKLSPLADEIRTAKSKHKNIFLFHISYKRNDFITRMLQAHRLQKRVSVSPSHQLVSIFGTWEEIEKLFLHNDEVLLIDVIVKPPKEELAVGGFDLSANKINMVHNRFPLINGLGQHVSIKENYYDTTDIDLKGRLEVSPLATSTVTSHANYMATISAGAGNSVYHAKGAAWAARISSSSFQNVLPDPTAYYSQYNITVQNHSYGTPVDNSYGLNAAAFDKSANENISLLHVIGAGNSGDVTSTSGIYSGIAAYANLSGNFKMAKNPVVVGGVDSFGRVVPLSSKGPAHDGRIKPDITAFQKNGTSESAALVSGTVLLLQQYYKNKTGNQLASALSKAILVNSADDINNTGPDYATGFGNLNAIRAMDVIKENTLMSGIATQNSVQSFTIDIPHNISGLKITLVWNDAEANPFSPKALVNDLDLTLVSTATNEEWKPWVLSSFPHIDSLNKLPLRKRDSLNNVEQVTLQNPAAGNYQVKISGFNLPSASQTFYIVYSMDTLNHFQWQYPDGNDFLETGRENILRWETELAGSGSIEYSIVPSNTWSLVSANYDLTKKYFNWNPPDTTAQSLLRMKVGNTYFYSDTFLIAGLPAPKVGFVCSDSVLLYWNKITGISQYQVYQLGDKYMEPMVKVSDTAVLLFKKSLTSKYFAVSAVLSNGIAAPKSYAFDYTAQATGCFIKTFLADANGNIAKLTLLIGTTYQVSSIVFQKFSSGKFITIDSVPAGSQTTFIYNHQPLAPGISLFRAKIILKTGNIIYSDIASVFYVEAGKYILLPIPLQRNTDLEILSTMPDGSIIQLYDIWGRRVLVKEIHSAHEYLNTSSLQPGQYFYRITKNLIKVASGKLLIL